MKNLVLINNVEKIFSDKDKIPELGEWFECKSNKGKDFVCVTHIGSNYLRVEGIHVRGCYSYTRVHFDEIEETLIKVSDHQSYIQSKINFYKGTVKHLLQEVKEISHSLGLKSINKIGYSSESSTKDLVCLSGQDNIGQYKTALQKAKKEDLPKLFEQIKKNNELLAAWMSAETLPMKAMVNSMKTSISGIDERIFKVSLYAGLTENTKHCREGKPATIETKLHIMQRRLYMDEECLLGYRHGGMEFKNIEKFDQWISEDKNFKRILPFPRTIVAMKVRRNEKHRRFDGQLSTALINFRLGEADKLTFLYIRNGDNLHRLNTELDFDEFIFPNKEEFNLTSSMMLRKRSCEVITIHDYDERLKYKKEQKIFSDQWEKENPKVHYFKNPYRHTAFRFSPDSWEPFNSDSVYYDDTMKAIHKRMNQYNRIVLIIQGLFDRSEVLHPHPPVKTWDQSSFNQHITLHYDGSESLYGSLQEPNFDAYFNKLNKLLTKESHTIGQDKFWGAREAEKENNRRDRNWHSERSYDYEYYAPYGNSGPGYVAKPAKFGRKYATYIWYRERMNRSLYGDNEIKCTIRVPKEILFNVSAYKPGDYLQFFQDPRTRQQYLKWAPMLLRAEEFKSSKNKD